MGKGLGRRRPFTQGGDAVVIAVPDEEFDAFVKRAPKELMGRPVTVVRASTLDDPDTEADLWFGRYEPATPTCEKICSFMQNGAITLFEQDQATDAVYREGKLVWPSAPIEFWNATDDTTRPRPVADGALLFMDGERYRITTIPDILVVVRGFRTRALAAGEEIPPDWKGDARRMLAGGPPHGTRPGRAALERSVERT